MESTNCTILTQDASLRAAVTAALEGVPKIGVVRGPAGLATPENVVQFFQTSPARIVFLDVRDLAALQISGEMELRDPGLQFIALGESAEPNVSWRGIQERLALPLDAPALREAVGRRIRVLEKLPTRLRKPTSFLSFLPAKAGVGATTIACGVADILATEYKTLLCDFDLATGTIGFRYRLERTHTLPEIAADFDSMDEHIWSQVVSRSGDLSILPSSLRPTSKIRPESLAHWFEILRANYDVVIFDLSGQMEDFSFEIMNASRQIFLVTTQEVECLHAGRKKTEVLREAGLEEKASALLNRYQKTHTLKSSDVQDVLQLDVRAQFPNDYSGVQNSIRTGTCIRQGSALSKALAAFAPATTDTPEPVTSSHKFLEFVNLPVLNYWRRHESRNERWV
jgi:MinD-like ATPase involved in chromosome partitioning or flagellar assembly